MAAAPVVPDRRALVRAARMIGPYVRRTPVRAVGDGLLLKLELEQHTGSFKPRGAFHGVLHDDVAPTRLVAASGGNHGLAVAHVGRTLGIPVEVFVPEAAPAVKVAGLRSLGAVVHQGGASYAEALAASRTLAERPGTLALHAYDGSRTVAGQGTLGLELEDQVPDVETVVVAVGGGGLVGGVAAWAATRSTPPRVVAVETVGCPTLHAALAAGRPVEVAPSGIAADSLGASRIGEVGLAAVSALADRRALLVDDDQVRSARQALWADHGVAAEAGGATAWAALHSGAYVPAPGERVVVVVCGGNADHTDLPGWPGSPT
ncbi:MAG: serine/threonine dehydratase [Nocardioides sp.]|nr:serine/threonine dehydratase [Nocardioides sp.]